MCYRLRFIIVLTGLISGCASNDANLEPTIGSLSEKTAQIDPQVQFKTSRQQAIDSYRALVQITENGIGSGDEIRRLADLELEASLDNRLADESVKQQQGLQESRNAIKGYEDYLKLYPNRGDNDYILYQLSRAYALDSKPEQSLDALDRLTSKFPDSRYIDEAQFRRGEDLFFLREYAAAEDAYEVVIKQHPDSLYYEKSLYKSGWAQFKQNRFRDALDSYIAVLDFNASSHKIYPMGLSPDLSRADKELLDDVVRVTSLVFSYEAEEMSLRDYFNQAGQREYEPLIYLSLGDHYMDKQRLTDAADIFLAYGKQYPYSRYTPEFHQKAILGYQKAGFSTLVLEQKQVFVTRYDVNTEFWKRQDQTSRSDLKPALTKHLRDLATHYHAQARASKKVADYNVAANWYRHYLRSFPDDRDAHQINFLLAESLFDARQYASAIEEYEKTAYRYPTHKNSAEAGYAALLSYDALFQQSKSHRTKTFQQQRTGSALKFSQAFPSDPRMPAVLLQSAKQLFEWQDYPNATQAAYRLVDDQRIDKDIHRSAWTIIGHSHYSTGQYNDAEAAYIALLPLLPKNSKTSSEIREQLAASIYKQGEAERNAGNHLAAAGHFSRLGVVVPDSPKRVVADYDAATAYIELKDWPQAIVLLKSFRKRYPREQRWKTGVSEKLALAYSMQGNHALAAGEMMIVAASTQSATRKRDLMWGAAELYQKAGIKAEAIAIYKTYVRAYPDPLKKSIELQFRIAESYREANNTKQLHYWLNEIIKADANAKGQRSSRSKYLAATASIELTQPLQRSFESVKLTVPLKKSLKKKKRLMQQSIAAYTRALDYQVEEVTTEATYQIAEIYHSFANALLDSQRPRGLDEEQLEEYELLLEDQAYPFEEKAIDIHLTNFRRIPKGAYNQSVKNSLKVLGDLMPFRYGKMEVADAYVQLQ
ncbi:MAG: tetratricopeptide repeat protein [Gammaproteobacteria bacterium]|nr:tetratricopeptide repeat protein [Gammaproteobacteria bacterium]